MDCWKLDSHRANRQRIATFDNAIARACRKARKAAKLNCGQANGFTFHSLRHTFVTGIMEATGDVALVMSNSRVCFIATEFIDGETLRQHVSGRRLKLVDVSRFTKTLSPIAKEKLRQVAALQI